MTEEEMWFADIMSIATQLETALICNDALTALTLVMQQQEALQRALATCPVNVRRDQELRDRVRLAAERIENQMVLLSQAVSSVGHCLQQVASATDTWNPRSRV